MSEGSSGGFATFLKSSAERLSSKKNVKFLPPQTKNKGGETTEVTNKSQKEHRRAQVRKAQIEHRQRKENYTKHLEQDVIRLRDMISKTENEASAIRQENASIKTTLEISNVPIGAAPSSHLQTPQEGASTSEYTSFQPTQGNQYTSLDFQYPQNPKWPSSSSSSNVSMIFDDIIDGSCLQMSAPRNFDNATQLNSPDIFSFPANTLSQLAQKTPENADTDHQNLLPPLPGQIVPKTSDPMQPDLSTIAINFILALEHPCRTHFAPRPTDFDPTGNPSGHELMASTFLYAHAPPSTFSNLNYASWTAPSLELTQLWQMSQSLPKGDYEITPVQAWFLLIQNYEVGNVLSKLDALKGGVAKLMDCFQFGAVMDELTFWNVVKSVMSG